MPTTPPPAPAPTIKRTPPLSGTWTIEQRRFLGFVLGAACLGIIIGAKLGRGSVPEASPTYLPAPCPHCAERNERGIQAERAARAAAVPGRPLPGDVPPVAFVAPTQPGQGAASMDISGAIVDNSKGHVMDPTFIAGGGDASSVPGQ